VLYLTKCWVTSSSCTATDHTDGMGYGYALMNRSLVSATVTAVCDVAARGVE
jgi:hypothetical protein